jgi:hypothetical protein
VRWRALPLGLVLCASGCGSRSGLALWDTDGGGGAPSTNECTTAFDCELVDPCAPPECVDESGVLRCRATPISCDDLDPCTTDRCGPIDGICTHRAPSDLDGDGFVGVAQSELVTGCGSDCDDENPQIYPSAPEICDGLDNDCDGGVDEGTVLAAETSPVRLAPDSAFATSHGGMVFTGDAFAATYTEYGNRLVSYLARVVPGAAVAPASEPVSSINADTYAGALARSSRGLFTAWSDARQSGNYEVYATRFSFTGEKLQADLRLSDTTGKSLHPTVAAIGEEYVVVWDDRALGDQSGSPTQLFGRRLSHGGALLGDEVSLASSRLLAESPVLAASKTRLGLVYTDLVAGVSRGFFQVLGSDLSELTAPIDLGVDYVHDPSIAFVGDEFVVSFHVYDQVPGPNVLGIAFDESGGVRSNLRALTTGDSFVRGPSLLSFGDRVLLVWAGGEANGHFDLYASVLDKALTPIRERQRLVQTIGHAAAPLAVAGALGQVGVVFNEMGADGSSVAYLLALECRAQSLR